MAEEVSLRAFGAEDRDWVVAMHGQLYADAEGYDQGFEKLVGEIVDGFIAGHDPARERGWVAERGGERLGSIFCARADAETAQLRLFLVMPEARGLGIGKLLIAECLRFARAAGYARMKLWTHSHLETAIALYARSGFELTAEWPSAGYGVEVVEQIWERAL